eukprot:s2957_g5.t1
MYNDIVRRAHLPRELAIRRIMANTGVDLSLYGASSSDTLGEEEEASGEGSSDEGGCEDDEILEDESQAREHGAVAASVNGSPVVMTPSPKGMEMREETPPKVEPNRAMEVPEETPPKVDPNRAIKIEKSDGELPSHCSEKEELDWATKKMQKAREEFLDAYDSRDQKGQSKAGGSEEKESKVEGSKAEDLEAKQVAREKDGGLEDESSKKKGKKDVEGEGASVEPKSKRCRRHKEDAGGCEDGSSVSKRTRAHLLEAKEKRLAKEAEKAKADESTEEAHEKNAGEVNKKKKGAAKVMNTSQEKDAADDAKKKQRSRKCCAYSKAYKATKGTEEEKREAAKKVPNMHPS